ncbi:MAG: excinuclease ABC subunit UvrC [Nannocystis sp.]|nr:excinuclease ABC subunit UvrC [Nannocystis sp.]MBA3547151.1 excinuclease ABC subunit UvrC [Nannocystis sp.]
MSTRPRNGSPPEPTPEPAAEGAKTSAPRQSRRTRKPKAEPVGEAEVESAAENLELADAMAIDLDEPGRFSPAHAAATIAPVVDAAWEPRARSEEQLLELVERLPDLPGVYVMRDRKGTIVYVGKARRLRARVRQYFNGTDTRHFVPFLSGLLGDIETVVTSNDKEALLLENNLIKRHRPRFNVKLRDDKQFLVLRLDPKANWPRLELVRRMRQDGASYFGPYHSANSARHTLRVVNRYFKLRTCTDYTLAHRSRPCLQHQIGRCPAPCVYPVEPAAYHGQVKNVSLFLDGRHKDLVTALKGQMEAAAAALEFESAARLRDQLTAIETSLEHQQVVDINSLDQDVIGMYREGGQVEFVVLHVRQGKLLGNRSFSARGMELPDAEVLGSFLLAYYDDAPTIPDEVILPTPLVEDDEMPLKAWLREDSGRKVAILVPERGDRKKLLGLAQKNAASSFASRRNRQQDSDQALTSLKQRLGLSRLPRVIECYDISHIQGSDTVASMVVFVDGVADRKRYRSFKIRGLDGLAQGDRQNDDFASMAEVLGRRLRRGLAKEPGSDSEGESPEDSRDAWALPDLLVIDGGKGQLGRVLAMMRDLEIPIGAGGIDVVSLAKERKVDIGRGKSALQQLREHKARLRAKPMPGVLTAEDAPNGPTLAQQLQAEGQAAAAQRAAAATGSESTPAALEVASPVIKEAATSEAASSEAISSEATSSGVVPSADESRPGETFQDYILKAEEEDPADAEVRPERVFVPGAKDAIRLRPGSSELFLMTQIRDEAHRFAITHHRKRRGKRALHSALDEVPGVGPALKKALLQAFGSVAAIAAADDAALTAIKGVGPSLARKLRETLGTPV